MAFEKDLLNIIEKNINDPAFILDSDAYIYNLNEYAKKIFPNAAENKLFFDLFKPEISDKLKEVIEDSKLTRESVSKKFHSFETGVQIDLEIVISAIEINYEQRFLVTAKRNEIRIEPWKINKIEIYTSEIKKLVKDKAVIDIIEKIKSSFPFSFIGKSKIQKEIDNLEHYFWIKDLDRKFIITNNSFAKWLGLRIENIEGKKEHDYLPPYLHNLFSTIDDYVIDTSNIVVFEGVLNFTKDEETTEIVELPIYDSNKNVVAICGVTQDSSNRNSNISEHFNYYENTIQNFTEPLVIADKEHKIVTTSSAINQLLKMDSSFDLRGKTIEDIFGEALLNKISQAITNSEYNKKIIFEVNEGERAGNYEVLIHKILNTRNNLSGYYLYFNNRNDNESSTSIKVKMYDIIMQTSPEAIFIYDIDNLKFLEVNDSALKLYGYNREEFLQMDLTDLYAPEDIQTLLDSSSVIASDSKFTGPWRHKKRDSSSILVMLSKTGLNYKGKRSHLNIVKDVTEKLDLDKKMQLFKATFENSSDMVFFTDLDGFITFANKPAEKVLGFSKKDFEKKPFLSLLSDSDRAKVNKEVFHSDSKSHKSIEVELKKENGELIPVELISTPVLNYNNEIELFNVTIKQAKEFEVIQKRSDTSGDSGSKMDSNFLSQLFHELLTPINVIIGFAGELTEGDGSTPEELKEAADIIKENQKQLMQTMDTAVEYSNVEQNLVTLRTEEILFVDIINELEASVKKLAESNEVTLTYGKISSSLSFISDKQRFMTFISQLLKFAIITTKEGKIYLSAYQHDDSNFMVSFKDTINGVSDNLVKNLQDVFDQDEDILHNKFGISKFTLRLTKRLLDIFNARIEIVHKNGKIAEYGIVFPMKLEGGEQIETVKAAPAYTPPIHEEPPMFMDTPQTQPQYVQTQQTQVVEAVATKTPVDISKLTCLYVEDQVDSQILFKIQMKDLQKIDFATSFEKAMPLLQNNQYDFIVLDINLQGEYNGLDALRVIQKMPKFANTPTYAVTAYALPGDQDRFKAAGFTDFVSKPILREKLIEVITASL